MPLRTLSRLFTPKATQPEPAAPQAPPPGAGELNAEEKAALAARPWSEVVGLLDMRLNGWFNNEAQELAPGFRISDDDVVVDVGAGDGGMALFCARAARQTILIDTDAARLEQSVERLKRAGVAGVEGRVADGAQLPLPDAVASRVICTEVLEHVDDPSAVMAELVRIGQPGALYLLSAPGAVSEHLQQGVAAPSYFEKPNHIRIFEPDEFTQLVERAGLVIEQRSVYGFFWAMYWMFFWPAGVELGQEHPLLDAWSRTWWELLQTPDGPRVKAKLDAIVPKVNGVVARKPG
jgi:SAM-dependent methyltransferase